MLKIVSLTTLFACALATTTITISTDGDSCVKTADACTSSAVASRTTAEPAVGALPRESITVIRDTWAMVERNVDIAPKMLLKMFQLYPMTQNLIPLLRGVSLEDMPTNKRFLQLAYGSQFAMSAIVDKLHRPDMLEEIIGGGMHAFVDGLSTSFQMAATTALFNKIMTEELGSAYTAEAQEAFIAMGDMMTSIMVKAEEDRKNLTEEDKTIVLDTLKAMDDKGANVGAKAILKMVRTHPDSAYLFPGLEGVSVAEMAKSEAVNSIGKKAAGIAQFMVANINEPSVVKSIVSSKKMSSFFMPNVDVRQQWQEAARVIIEAVSDIQGDAFTPRVKQAFGRVIEFYGTYLKDAFLQ